MTSTDSTAVYSEAELNKFLSYVKEIKQVGGNYGVSAWVAGKSSIVHSIECPSWSSQAA